METKKHLIVIVGPTAIGKTALSIRLAQQFNCEIVSCDSRQFFKEMTVGTAVPDADELAAATHHFIHNKSIHEEYSVGDFEKEAIALLDKLFEKQDYTILVGGSGLYVDAVLKGFDSFPEIEASVREDVRRNYESHGIAYLQQQLSELDPAYYESADIQNPQRLMRALEVCIGTGQSYSAFRKNNVAHRNFQPIIIGLDAPREIIYDRINRRVDIMMENGLLEEARHLYPNKYLNALQTVGYRELFDYFDGKLTLQQAIEEIKKNTRRFAKRQLTWFRKTPDVHWIAYDDPQAAIRIISTSED